MNRPNPKRRYSENWKRGKILYILENISFVEERNASCFNTNVTKWTQKVVFGENYLFRLWVNCSVVNCSFNHSHCQAVADLNPNKPCLSCTAPVGNHSVNRTVTKNSFFPWECFPLKWISHPQKPGTTHTNEFTKATFCQWLESQTPTKKKISSQTSKIKSPTLSVYANEKKGDKTHNLWNVGSCYLEIFMNTYMPSHPIMPDLGHSVAQKKSVLARLWVWELEIPLARWPMGMEASQCGGFECKCL